MSLSLTGGARLGIGTYRGSEDSATDEKMCEIIQRAFRLGIRMVDTAVNYRCGRSEAVISRALSLSTNDNLLRREDVTICTKGGFTRPSTLELPAPPAPEEHSPLDHCFRPACLRYQLELSLRTLGLDKIDVYYLHNPEQQRDRCTPETFCQLMRSAFQFLENAVAEGLISAYGIATWTGAEIGQRWSFESLKALASDVANTICGTPDHFWYLQAPLSINRQTALIPTYPVDGEHVSLVKMCERLGLRFIASASAGGGRVPSLAATSVRWVRAVPGVNTALVGTLRSDHLQDLIN